MEDPKDRVSLFFTHTQKKSSHIFGRRKYGSISLCFAPAFAPSGLHFSLPCVESHEVVDMRTITLCVPPQEVAYYINHRPKYVLHPPCHPSNSKVTTQHPTSFSFSLKKNPMQRKIERLHVTLIMGLLLAEVKATLKCLLPFPPAAGSSSISRGVKQNPCFQ